MINPQSVLEQHHRSVVFTLLAHTTCNSDAPGGNTMMFAKSPLICASTLLLFSCYTARADHKEIQGRTGLPKVVEGKNNVSIEKGVVYMDAIGSQLQTTQEFWLHYPGPRLET